MRNCCVQGVLVQHASFEETDITSFGYLYQGNRKYSIKTPSKGDINILINLYLDNHSNSLQQPRGPGVLLVFKIPH